VHFIKVNLRQLALQVFLSLAGTSLGQPVITTQSSTNDFGTAATFRVAATGTTPLAYQWQKLSGTWSDMAGFSATNLSIPRVQTRNAGDLVRTG
jgi:hypothetical protein